MSGLIALSSGCHAIACVRLIGSVKVNTLASLPDFSFYCQKL